VQIEDTFTVKLPIDDAWKVFLDVERIAPCMPGAELHEIEGNEHRGVVKVKVGPITAQYKGAAVIETADEANRVIAIKASGRDTRGQGNASATVNVKLVEAGTGTQVSIVTDLTVTGKVAQFGRGVMQEVSSKLLGQFVKCLEDEILNAPASPAAGSPVAEPVVAAEPSAPVPDGAAPSSTGTVGEPTTSTGATPPTVRKIDSKPAQPVDLMAVSGNSILKRVAPIIAVIVAILLLRRLRRR
jgi:uncharacterized protein